MFARFWCWKDPVTFLRPLDKKSYTVILRSKSCAVEDGHELMIHLSTSNSNQEGAPKKGAFNGPQCVLGTGYDQDSPTIVTIVTQEVTWYEPTTLGVWTCHQVLIKIF